MNLLFVRDFESEIDTGQIGIVQGPARRRERLFNSVTLAQIHHAGLDHRSGHVDLNRTGGNGRQCAARQSLLESGLKQRWPERDRQLGQHQSRQKTGSPAHAIREPQRLLSRSASKIGPWTDLMENDASVDVECLPGGESAIVRKQELDRPCQVFGKLGPRQRAAGDRRVPRLLWIPLENALRLDEARRDHVDPDPVGAELVSQHPREADQGRISR